MKTTIYKKIALLLLLLPIIGLANNDFNGRHTKEKKITKRYEVNANALLEIDNKYGNIDITTWKQNRVEIVVTIKTNGNDEESVQKRLEEIDVKFDYTKSHVSAETQLENSNKSWWSKLINSTNNVNLEINYRIKAPITNNVDLNNDYGSITLDKLEGNANISCDYGRLFIGELLGNENYLNFDYTRNSHIGVIKRGKINADYSEYTIEEAGTLDVVADYTKSNIEKVEHLSFNCDYGSMRIGLVKNVKGQGDYLGTEIGSVYSSLDLGLDYGSASIDKIMKDIQIINIDSDYTSLRVGYDASAPFSFKISTSYAKVKGLEGRDFEVNKRHQTNTKDYFEGNYLSDAGGTVTINSSYGSVTFID